MRRDSMFSYLMRMFRYVGRYLPLYLPGLLLMGMQNTLVSSSFAKILRLIVDIGTQPEADILSLLAPSAFSVLLYLLLIMLGFVAFTFSLTKGEKAMRSDVFRHVLRAKASTLLGRHSGEWITMVTQHPTAAKQAIDWPLAGFLMGIVGPISAVIISARVNLTLTLLPTIAGLLVFAFNLWCTPRIRNIIKARLKLEERATARMLDLFQGYAIIRAFSIAKRIATRYLDEASALRNNYIKQGNYESWKQFVMVLCVSTIEPFIVLLGMLLVRQGAMSIGDVVEVAALSGAIVWSLSYVSEAYTDLVAKLASVERVIQAVDLPQEQLTGAEAGRDAQTAVEARDVVFAYPSRPDDAVLQGLSLSLASGASLALVGPSGGGKSTILKLLLRLYEEKSGHIAVQGTPVGDWNVDALRAQFALVPQMPQLFDGTVLQNIELGRPGAGQGDIERAAQLANADEFIRALPDGYATRVGERGAQLSGGQCQRIAIARAFLKDAPVLLLDEATSALDGVSEAAVQQALDKLITGRTVLLVAHRLSTARRAQKIMYVAEGYVQETGSHDELLAQNGKYAALWRAQNKAQTA